MLTPSTKMPVPPHMVVLMLWVRATALPRASITAMASEWVDPARL